ncbi:MAG: recombinase zinc beta ribbon domain-containing protein [Pseudonocardia sp.]|nr:recombinase zinc beta ribbon domain-containing protein [Pseudonocardia sp.]
MTCALCGKRYLGTSATGRHDRYRYYTCYTRQRYGPDACPAERLPADQIEHAVLYALLDTYQRTELVDEAAAAVAAALTANHDNTQAELDTIDTELAALDVKTDRLINAIENGLDHADAIERITANRQRTNQLRQRRNDLADLTTRPLTCPTQDQISDITTAINDAITAADVNTTKRLFTQLLHKVTVTGRNNIKPYFRVPMNEQTLDPGSRVRTLSGSVPPTGFEPVLPP